MASAASGWAAIRATMLRTGSPGAKRGMSQSMVTATMKVTA